jgi:hypothetical protein
LTTRFETAHPALKANQVHRPTLDYRSPTTNHRPSGEIPAAIVGLTIFGLTALLFVSGMIMFWASEDFDASCCLGSFTLIVLIPLACGIWANARVLMHQPPTPKPPSDDQE